MESWKVKDTLTKLLQTKKSRETRKKKNETRGPVQGDQHLNKRKSRKRETGGEKIFEKESEESISQGGMT